MRDLVAATLALRDMAASLGIKAAPQADRAQLEARVRAAVVRVLKAQHADVLDKLGDPPDLGKLDASFWNGLTQTMRDAIDKELETVYVEAARDVLQTAGSSGVDWSQVNQQAAEWARTYSYELVTNVTATTRDLLQRQVGAFYADTGTTMGDLRDSIADVFGPVRADAIAVTETTRASVEGSRATVAEIEANGVRMREFWVTGRNGCPEICEPLDGLSPQADGLYHHPITGETYDGPPAHPHCDCNTRYEMVIPE